MGATTSETTPELGGRGKLDSAKARRIVAAMHASVGRRGAAGSTFDQVAGEAGVSRGLLHYYFGSKERLLAEVVRHDCDVRLAKLDEALDAAEDIDAIVDILVSALEDLVERDPGAYALIFELFTASRQNEELREEMAELYRRIRDHVSSVLDAKEQAGVVKLRGTPRAWHRCSSRWATAWLFRCSPTPTGTARRLSRPEPPPPGSCRAAATPDLGRYLTVISPSCRDGSCTRT